MTDPVDEMFQNLKYPGSNRTVRNAAASLKTNSRAHAHAQWDKDAWGQAVIKYIKGTAIELYPSGSFARALGRSLVTVRLWERLERLPKAPFLMPGNPGPRGESVSRRYYSELSITNALQAFDDAGLLDAPRIDWGSEEALEMTARIRREWDAEVATYA